MFSLKLIVRLEKKEKFGIETVPKRPTTPETKPTTARSNSKLYQRQLQTGSGHRNRKWPSGTNRFKPDSRDSVTATSLKRKFRNLGTIGSITNPSANSNSLNPALDNDQDDLPLSDLTKMAKILSSVPALRFVFISKLTRCHYITINSLIIPWYMDNI